MRLGALMCPLFQTEHGEAEHRTETRVTARMLNFEEE